MSLFNEIQEGGLNQVLLRRLDIKGDVPAPTVTPEITPGLVLENDRPEWGWLKGERLCSRYVSVGPVAAQTSYAQIYLPSTVTDIVIIEEIVSQTTNQFALARAGIGAGLGGWGALTVATRDSRWAANRTSAILETTSTAAAATLNPALGVVSGIGLSYDAPLIVTPGTALVIYGLVVNQAVQFNLIWRERVAQYSELV